MTPNQKRKHMLKKILSRLIYLIFVLYALAMLAMIVSSGAIIAILFVFIIGGYILCMLASIRALRRLERLKETVLSDFGYQLTKRDKPLALAMVANLPYYFIYLVLALIPMDFPALWIVAGLPCCVVTGLRPINKNYQTYNFITNRGKAYWLLQILLAFALWLGGRAFILYVVLGGAS